MGRWRRGLILLMTGDDPDTIGRTGGRICVFEGSASAAFLSGCSCRQGGARSPLLPVNSAKVRSNNKNTSQQQYDHTRAISCRSAPICAESNNNMITPKINNNTACKARPRPAGIFHAHLPSFLPVWLALATPGDGTRSAARVRTRTSPPLHAPPIPLVHPTCVLTPPRLTAPPPCHRRLS